MKNYHSVIIIGCGQAGLSTSYYLKKNNIDHLVLDKGNVGDTWRNKRWDSFCLVTQNWQCQLPGFPYKGEDPEGFMTREEIVDYLERYAEFFKPPIKSGVSVNRIYFSETRSVYVLETSEGEYFADKIVIAIGTHQNKRVPTIAGKLPADIKQIHSSEYKNAGLLPKGAVLVVGSGQSGCQIAEDLNNSGLEVYLSVSRAPRIPRRYRGKDILQWADIMGLYDIKIDDHPEGKPVRFKTHPHVSGHRGGHTINLRMLAIEGINLLGRLNNIDGYKAIINDDLVDSLNNADSADAKMKNTIDEYIEKHNLSAPLEPVNTFEWEPEESKMHLDLNDEGIKTVIWSTGYCYDYSWVDVPVFDENGYPSYERGVTEHTGLYFVGLHWMHTWGSGLFYGVGKDAEYIAHQIIYNTDNLSLISEG